MILRFFFAASSPRAARALLMVYAGLMLVAAAEAERLPLRVYTTADGLVRDHITRIVPDSRGYIWFSTTDGLSRFDGYRFTNFGGEQGLPARIIAFTFNAPGEQHDTRLDTDVRCEVFLVFKEAINNIARH